MVKGEWTNHLQDRRGISENNVGAKSASLDPSSLPFHPAEDI